MAKEQDQSMEEILQSIKRIIAEEGDAPVGSDVLELTDMVGEDGSLSSTEAAAPPEPALSIKTMSIEEIISAPSAPEEVLEPAPAPTIAPIAPTPAPKPQPEAPVMANPSEETLASAQTISKSAAALEALKTIPQPETPMPPASGIHLRNGTTIEDLVLEGLRPMLKEWLDANLPGMVERLVEREIKKITAR